MSCHSEVKKNLKNYLSSYRSALTACFCLFLTVSAVAQSADSTVTVRVSDTTATIDTIPAVDDRPRKATIWALTLPGAGQIYNKKYWKVPILYAGFAGLGYAVAFNQGEYKRFGDDYKKAVDDDPNTVPDYQASAEQLRDKRNYYKKYRDLSIIGIAALYALQALDANVDAHLSSFDVNDDLSFNLAPSPYYETGIPRYGFNSQTVFSLSYRF